MSDSTRPLTGPRFACPVCLKGVVGLYVWRGPQSERIRIFCGNCATLPPYRALREEECLLYAEEAFNRMAGERLLRRAFGKEHPEA